ncbi:hypothetical protein GDO81_021921 [Engystomops pustulosus]|uniref:Uncharacterized protein n=1 Tax=Engystomops pustulosus TaxID=76066 RepID=A0AAV6ZXH6_ENGPU|nr:hypothetical protein GDO81_021921 [Engystomops pustulosus]
MNCQKRPMLTITKTQLPMPVAYCKVQKEKEGSGEDSVVEEVRGDNEIIDLTWVEGTNNSEEEVGARKPREAGRVSDPGPCLGIITKC